MFVSDILKKKKEWKKRILFLWKQVSMWNCDSGNKFFKGGQIIVMESMYFTVHWKLLVVNYLLQARLSIKNVVKILHTHFSMDHQHEN
jgi:hypothetical protein